MDLGIHNQSWRWRTLPPQSGIVVSHMFTRWVVSMFRQYLPPFSWIQCAIWEEILCEQLLTQIAINCRDTNCIIIYVHTPRAQGEIQVLTVNASLAPCLILCGLLHHQNSSPLRQFGCMTWTRPHGLWRARPNSSETNGHTHFMPSLCHLYMWNYKPKWINRLANPQSVAKTAHIASPVKDSCEPQVHKVSSEHVRAVSAPL